MSFGNPLAILPRRRRRRRRRQLSRGLHKF